MWYKHESFSYNPDTMSDVPIDINFATNLIRSSIQGKTLSNIRLSFWTLFLEFGELDEDKLAWEFWFMIDPSWKFQSGYNVVLHINLEPEELEKAFPQYVGKKLEDCYIIEATNELFLDFWDIYFTTLSTSSDTVCRNFSSHMDKYRVSEQYIWFDNKGIYLEKNSQHLK